MIDFAKLAKVFLWITSTFLAMTFFLFPLYNGITNNHLYAKGYEANGAYNHILYDDVWMITEHVQHFFKEDIELLFFPSNEAAHLLEVKGLITILGLLFSFCIVGFAVSLGLTIRFGFQSKFGKLQGVDGAENEKIIFNFKDHAKKKFYLNLFASMFKNSGIILFALLLLVSILASSWDWFFTIFHEVVFSGQWMFPSDTLMIHLWMDPFFLVAAKFIAVRIILIICLLFSLSYVLEIVQKKVVL